MNFIFLTLAGFVGGMLGGMGMGGGTLLIPILTLILNVEQHVAQAANLAAFLPMSIVALKIHFNSGLVKTDGVAALIIPAVLFSVAGGLVAAILPSSALKKLFGAFLVCLALKELFLSNYFQRK